MFSLTAVANPLNVKAVEERPALSKPAAEPPRAVVLTGASSAFIVGDRIGQLHAGANCNEVVEREWSDLIQQRISAELPRVFSEQLGRANYSSGGEQGQGKPLEISAFINDIDMKICRGSQGAWQGGIYVQVGWQLISSTSGRVLYQASTEGSYVLSEARRVSAGSGLREALAVSVRNLLADGRFAAVLRQQDHDGRVAAADRWH